MNLIAEPFPKSHADHALSVIFFFEYAITELAVFVLHTIDGRLHSCLQAAGLDSSDSHRVRSSCFLQESIGESKESRKESRVRDTNGALLYPFFA